MTEKINKYAKEFAPLIVLSIVIVLMHLNMHESDILDAKRYFATVLDQYSMRAFLSIRYHTWSSRIVIEAVLAILARHLVLWGILDSLVMILLFFSMKKILGLKNNEPCTWILVGTIFMYYMGDMSSAGWVASLMNYMWPLAFGAFVMGTAVDGIRGEKVSPIRITLSFPALIYAANMEQMSALLLAFYILAIAYEFIVKNKRPHILLWIGFIIVICELIFIVTCPGNAVRATEEISMGDMTTYGMYSFIDKLLAGLDHALKTFVNTNVLLIAFSFVCALIFIVCFNSPVFAVLAVVPIPFVLAKGSKILSPLYKLISNGDLRTGIHNFNRPGAYIVPFMWVMFILCIEVVIIKLSTSNLEAFILSMVMLGGFASKVIIGFSPSLTSSGSRTQIYLQFAFAFLTVYFAKKYEDKLKGNPAVINVLYTGVGLLAVMGVANSLGKIATWT
ncbi:MAG: hypothetical protein K6E13_03935 [Lachnospiraceae bacterium]|nr:hypothetical protein [Lachnospiraceae bacterium]